MSPNNPRAAALLLLLMAGPAAAAPARKPKPSYTKPSGWRQSQEEKEIYLTDGVRSIFIRRVDPAAAAKAAPELYGKAPGIGGAVVSTSTLTVGGAACQRVTRQFERPRGGGDSFASTDYVYEEYVLAPTKKKDVFWSLDFVSPSAAYRDVPRGLDDWKAFLKSFKAL